MKSDHIIKRGSVYHFRAVVGGRVFAQSLYTGSADVARARAADLFQSVLLGLWRDVEAVVRPKAAARRKASVGDVSAAYRDLAARLQRPAPVTVAYAIQSMIRIVRMVHSCNADSALAFPLEDALQPKVQDDYADAMLRRDGDCSSTRVSVCSALRTAKQIISRDMVPRLRRKVDGLPPTDVLDEWRAYRPFPDPQVEDHEFTEAEGILLRAAGAELSGPAWLAWALGFYAALRAGEAEAVRWNWIVRHEPTSMERAYAPWLAGREYVWLLRVQGTKTRYSVADVPLHDSVANMLILRRPASAADDDFMLGPTPTGRNLAVRQVSAWLRKHGWCRTKTTHALRAYRIQMWFNCRGVEARYRWGRHALKGMDAHYLARRYLGAEPLGVDQ